MALFFSGLETGNLTEWSGNSIDAGNTLQATSSEHFAGSWALQTTLGGINGNATLRHTYSSDLLTNYIQFYTKFPVAFSSNSWWNIMGLQDSTFADRLIAYISGSPGNELVFSYKDHTGGGHDTTISGAVNDNTWHQINIKFVVSQTLGELRVDVDGVNKINLTSIDTGTTNPIHDKYFGSYFSNGANTSTFYMDNFTIDSSPILNTTPKRFMTTNTKFWG